MIVARVFDEAQRRDPGHRRAWVALVDGNNHQIDRIKAEAKARKLTVAIVVDFIHVLEYLWGAAWCFFAEGDAGAEVWVADKATAVLDGHASTVAASIRRKATCCRLDAAKRAKADTCADYLLAKRPYLDYPTALAKGWPIATGVIEGACRHLVKDRMDIHRRPLERRRRRGRPQAPGTARQPRVPCVLAVSPLTRATTRSPGPLRRQRHPDRCATSLEKIRTQLDS